MCQGRGPGSMFFSEHLPGDPAVSAVPGPADNSPATLRARLVLLRLSLPHDSTPALLLGSFPCESIVRSHGSAPWLGLVGGRVVVRARHGCSGAQPRVERSLMERALVEGRGRRTGPPAEDDRAATELADPEELPRPRSATTTKTTTTTTTGTRRGDSHRSTNLRERVHAFSTYPPSSSSFVDYPLRRFFPHSEISQTSSRIFSQPFPLVTNFSTPLDLFLSSITAAPRFFQTAEFLRE